MQLEHSFSVPVGIDEAWKILLDIERIGPCMPGAVVDTVEGNGFSGTVKVKLGPINLTYKGKATFVETDEIAHRAVIDAQGTDARGNGTAAAKVTATLSETGGSTTVHVSTDLDMTGKPAQFSRNVMEDVGNKLISQFATSLAGIIRGGAGAEDSVPAAASGEASSPPPPKARPRPVKSTPPPAEPPPPVTEHTPQHAAEPPAEATEAAATVAPAAPQPPADEAASVEAPADTPVEAVADEGTPDEAAGAGDNDAEDNDAQDNDAEGATPSYAVPGGIPTGVVSSVSAVNGHLPRAQAEVEPLNLVDRARPAVAKRLAPVAVALVVVAAAIRRRTGKRA